MHNTINDPNVPQPVWQARKDSETTKGGVTTAIRQMRLTKAMRMISSAGNEGANANLEVTLDTFQQLHPAPADGDQPVPNPHQARGQMLAELADPDNAAYAELHPQVVARVSHEELLKLLEKCHTGSAPGPDGLTYAAIKYMAGVKLGHIDVESMSFRAALMWYLHRIFSQAHMVTKNEKKCMSASSMIFIPKDSGPNPGLRPLGITSVIARLANKLVLKRVTEYAARQLGSYQHALGLPDGCLVGAAKATAYMDEGSMTVMFDSRNAFGLCNRFLAYEELKANLPGLLPIYSLFYGESSGAFVNNGFRLGEIRSGVKQGDPLAMLAFCYAIQPLIKDIQSVSEKWTKAFLDSDDFRDQVKTSTPLVMAYADDVSCCIDPLLLLRDPENPDTICSLQEGHHSPWYREVIGRFKHYKFVPNENKTKAILKRSLVGFNDHLRPEDNGAAFWGIPVGTMEFCRKFVHDKAKKRLPLLTVPPGNDDGQDDHPGAVILRELAKQDSLYLVRFTFAPLIYHLCRALPNSMADGHGHRQSMMRGACETFDRGIDDWLRWHTGVSEQHLDTETFRQLRSIATGRGGLGIRSLAVARGTYSEILYYNASEQLNGCLGTLRQQGHIVEELCTKIMSARGYPDPMPAGFALWGAHPDGPYMGYNEWEGALYPNLENNMRARLSSEVYETKLLDIIFKRVLDPPLVNGIPMYVANLTTPTQQRGALAVWRSMSKSNKGVHTTPSSSDGTQRVSDVTIQQWCKLLFLQKPLYPHEIVGRCCDFTIHGEPIDLIDYPHHCLACQTCQGGKQARHDAIVDLLHPALKTALRQRGGQPAASSLVKEPLIKPVVEGLNPQPHYGVTPSRNLRNNGQGDRTLVDANEHRSDLKFTLDNITTLIDVAVVSPAHHPLLLRADGPHIRPGCAASEKLADKDSLMRKFLPAGHPELLFQPFVMELTGYIHPRSATWLKGIIGPEAFRTLSAKLAKSLARTTVKRCLLPCLAKIAQPYVPPPPPPILPLPPPELLPPPVGLLGVLGDAFDPALGIHDPMGVFDLDNGQEEPGFQPIGAPHAGFHLPHGLLENLPPLAMPNAGNAVVPAADLQDDMAI